MLERNHLYRRIEHNNLFRTFSRTYSRQGPAVSRGKVRHQMNGNNQKIVGESSSTIGSRFGYCKTAGLDPQTERLQQGGSMPIIIPQKQSIAEMRQPFTIALPQTGEAVGWMTQGLRDRKMSTNSLLRTWNQRKRQDNFQLKSCMQKKTINYESNEDQTDFSLLEVARRRIVMQQGRGMRISLGEIKKKGMTGLLPKYSRLLQQKVLGQRQSKRQ